MKKLVLSTILLLLACFSYAQIKVPSTYKFTKKVFGNPGVEQVTSYFIFYEANKVIWCLASHDGYIFPVADGSFNLSTRKIVLPKNHLMDEQMNLTYSQKNGGIEISYDGDEWLFDYCSNDGVMFLKECDYALTPSGKLVGSSWKYEDSKEKFVLYFLSKTSVLLDGEPRVYMVIDDAIGILSGDNPEDEALVGKWDEQGLYVHRSGFRNKGEYPHLTLKRVN